MRKYLGFINPLIVISGLFIQSMNLCHCIVNKSTSFKQKLEYAGFFPSMYLYILAMIILIIGVIYWKDQIKISKVLLIISTILLILVAYNIANL